MQLSRAVIARSEATKQSRAAGAGRAGLRRDARNDGAAVHGAARTVGPTVRARRLLGSVSPVVSAAGAAFAAGCAAPAPLGAGAGFSGLPCASVCGCDIALARSSV